MRTQTKPAALADGPVTTIMSQPVVAIRSGDPLNRALQAYAAAGVRHVAIVDTEDRCLGLLRDRTVVAAWLHYPMHFDGLIAQDVLDADQPMVAASSTIRDVARVMHRCGSDAVVVVDGDLRPIGVVTASDLVALIAKPQFADPSSDPTAEAKPADPDMAVAP
jgi:CBS domain-containing protein